MVLLLAGGHARRQASNHSPTHSLTHSLSHSFTRSPPTTDQQRSTLSFLFPPSGSGSALLFLYSAHTPSAAAVPHIVTTKPTPSPHPIVRTRERLRHRIASIQLLASVRPLNCGERTHAVDIELRGPCPVRPMPVHTMPNKTKRHLHPLHLQPLHPSIHPSLSVRFSLCLWSWIFKSIAAPGKPPQRAGCGVDHTVRPPHTHTHTLH
jgi:hypothetical protein